MKKTKGFTLIELMIVVAIIGILAAIAIPRFAQLIDKAREAGARGNLGAIRSAVAIYYGDNKGQWPVTLDKTVPDLPGGERFPAFMPNYLTKLPRATLQRGNRHNNTGKIRYTQTEPNEFITARHIVDTGGWIYSSRSGDCRISCKCRDTISSVNGASTLYYSNYGHEEP